ncbi:tRNA (guanine-N(1)-)-methyltransferase [candidate division SR1 bacterium]|nr:tRNA (guanine-N(1)-)-methyltransferase [candidate division SR1 bacterium]
MQITIITLFSELFDSFLSTSLLAKAREKGVLQFNFVNPRDFCGDDFQHVDDTVYGGGAGMLIKAKPVIDAVQSVISQIQKTAKNQKFHIIFPSPAEIIFDQKLAYGLSKIDHLIFVCGRYEGIDYRFEEYISSQYGSAFSKVSLGKFVLLGGEVASMTMIEAIGRLIPGVIKESESRQDESYNLKTGMTNLEFPHYTRPESVYGLHVPEVLLSGNQIEIENWRQNNTK